MVRLVKPVFWLLSLAYPFLIYWGLNQGYHSWLIIFLVILLLSKVILTKHLQEKRIFIATVLVMLALIFILGDELGLKFYPVMVNWSFLIIFGMSLLSSMPVIERFARLQEPSLPDYAVKYTRKVTWAWTIFFALNGFISLCTVLSNDETIWLVYNGLIAYVLIAAMVSIEWVIRRHVRKKYG